MGVSATDELASFLGGLSKEQKSLKENIVPDEIDSSFLLAPFQSIELASSVVVTAYFYPEDSFILDHPVYGELDSPLLKLDGGYAETTDGGFSFPATFPVTFVEGSSLEPSVMYTYSD